MSLSSSSFRVCAEDAGERLDRVLSARFPEVSRAVLQRLVREGAVAVDGAPARASHRLRGGEEVAVTLPPSTPSTLEPEDLPLDIVYEDRDLLVINKPSGMVVHPTVGTSSGTLVNAVLAHCAGELSRLAGEDRPGIVHRLDKDTSGLIMVAKTDRAHAVLAAQIKARTASRVYRGVLWGVPRFLRALIDAPIGRHPTHRQKRAVSHEPGARPAATELTVLEALGFCSLVEARLRTGRTHQIRVHCSHIGHPVLGDPLYGGLRQPPPEVLRTSDQRAHWHRLVEALGGQALHASDLEFDHPTTGERLSFHTDPPPPFLEVLDFLQSLSQSGA